MSYVLTLLLARFNPKTQTKYLQRLYRRNSDPDSILYQHAPQHYQRLSKVALLGLAPCSLRAPTVVLITTRFFSVKKRVPCGFDSSTTKNVVGVKMCLRLFCLRIGGDKYKESNRCPGRVVCGFRRNYSPITYLSTTISRDCALFACVRMCRCCDETKIAADVR